MSAYLFSLISPFLLLFFSAFFIYFLHFSFLCFSLSIIQEFVSLSHSPSSMSASLSSLVFPFLYSYSALSLSFFFISLIYVFISLSFWDLTLFFPFSLVYVCLFVLIDLPHSFLLFSTFSLFFLHFSYLCFYQSIFLGSVSLLSMSACLFSLISPFLYSYPALSFSFFFITLVYVLLCLLFRNLSLFLILLHLCLPHCPP